MPAFMSLSAARLRFVCASMWAHVLFMPAIVTLLDLAGHQPLTPPAWLHTARLVAAALALYGFVMPPLYVRLSRKASARMQERGVDPDRLRALVGLVGYGPPVVYGGILVILGDDLRIAYLAALISALGLAYWSWRYRHVLWSVGSEAESREARSR